MSLLPLIIGWRYTRAKRRGFLSFISLSALLGMALGIMVLITVLSVMNGFDTSIRARFFSLAPQVTVGNVRETLTDWPNLSLKLREHPGVLATAPLVGGQALLSHAGLSTNAPAMISGILPTSEKEISAISDKMITGTLDDLKPKSFGLILGRHLANNLQVTVGGKIRVLVPKFTATPAGILPRQREFTVVGLFDAGSGFGFDSQLAFMHMKDAQALLQMGDNVNALRVKIADPMFAPQIHRDLNKLLNMSVPISDWTEIYGPFFKAIQMEKTMMFLILMLIVAVAMFNLVSSMVMVVTDKRRDIAILRTLGLTPKAIMAIFIAQGIAIGLIGMVLGIIFGVILSLNITSWVDFLQNHLNLHLITSEMYFIDYLPSELKWLDVVKVGGLSLGLCVLATLYPAAKAAKQVVVEGLHDE